MHVGSEGALRAATLPAPVGLRGLVSFDGARAAGVSIVFPGLCCDMLFVVANIGSDGLLGQLWANGWSTLQLHQQRLAPELDGFLTTSVQ